jgi:Leucine-rich repeat (LRR) protein
LADQAELRFLSVQRTGVTDIAPLAGLTRLEFLYLSGCHGIDLAPLASLPSLSTISLIDTTPTLDVAPLTDLRNVEVLVGKAQELRNVRTLHRTVKIIRI